MGLLDLLGLAYPPPAGGPTLPPPGYMGVPPPYGPGPISAGAIPSPLTDPARMAAILGNGGGGQPSPGGPQAYGPIGGPPGSVSYGRPPAPPITSPLTDLRAPPPTPGLPGLAPSAAAATDPGGSLAMLQAPDLPPPTLDPSQLGPRAMAPGVLPMPRPPFQGSPPTPMPRPALGLAGRPSYGAAQAASGATPPPAPASIPPGPPQAGPAALFPGQLPPVPPGGLPSAVGQAGPPGQITLGPQGIETGPLAPSVSSAVGGGQGRPVAPPAGAQNPPQNGGQGNNGGGGLWGWLNRPLAPASPLAAMGLAPPAPTHLSMIGQALMGLGTGALQALASPDPAARRQALGMALAGAGQGYASAIPNYMRGQAQGLQALAELRKANQPLIVPQGAATADPLTGQLRSVNPEQGYMSLGPGDIAIPKAPGAMAGGAPGAYPMPGGGLPGLPPLGAGAAGPPAPGLPPGAIANPNTPPSMMTDFSKNLAAYNAMPPGPQKDAMGAMIRGQIAHETMPLAVVNSQPNVRVVQDPDFRANSLTLDRDKDVIKSAGAAADTFRNASPVIDALADAALHGTQGGGALTPLKLQAANLAQSLGFQLDPSTAQSMSDAALFKQLSSRVIPLMRTPGMTRETNFDLGLLGDTVAKLTDTTDQQKVMALGLKQMKDYGIASGDAIYQHIARQERADPRQIPTLEGLEDTIRGRAGASFIPHVRAGDAARLFGREPKLFRDADTGRLAIYTPGGG